MPTDNFPRNNCAAGQPHHQIAEPSGRVADPSGLIA